LALLVACHRQKRIIAGFNLIWQKNAPANCNELCNLFDLFALDFAAAYAAAAFLEWLHRRFHVQTPGRDAASRIASGTSFRVHPFRYVQGHIAVAIDFRGSKVALPRHGQNPATLVARTKTKVLYSVNFIGA
jgi:hypothetical protein